MNVLALAIAFASTILLTSEALGLFAMLAGRGAAAPPAPELGGAGWDSVRLALEGPTTSEVEITHADELLAAATTALAVGSPAAVRLSGRAVRAARTAAQRRGAERAYLRAMARHNPTLTPAPAPAPAPERADRATVPAPSVAPAPERATVPAPVAPCDPEMVAAGFYPVRRWGRGQVGYIRFYECGGATGAVIVLPSGARRSGLVAGLGRWERGRTRRALVALLGPPTGPLGEYVE